MGNENKKLIQNYWIQEIIQAGALMPTSKFGYISVFTYYSNWTPNEKMNLYWLSVLYSWHSEKRLWCQ